MNEVREWGHSDKGEPLTEQEKSAVASARVAMMTAYTFASGSERFKDWLAGRSCGGYFAGCAANGAFEYATLWYDPEDEISAELIVATKNKVLESARRLTAHPEHDVSRQSDEAEAASAIRGARTHTIYSFTGLHPEVNEAICLALALQLGEFARPEEALALAHITRNVFFKKLWEYIELHSWCAES